jgi:hypothetical protein
MDITTWILWAVLIIVVLNIVLFGWGKPAEIQEPFLDVEAVNLSELTTQALDAAPSTDELKNHYKALLIYVNDDLRKTSYKSLRILADFRNRVYRRCEFRNNFKTDDVLANWPKWLPPIDTTIDEPVPSVDDAVTAETKMLSYLSKNFPQEAKLDSKSVTNSVVRNLIEDFGYRFVFKRGKEVARLAPDFTPQNLLKDWVNPVGAKTTRKEKAKENIYSKKCIKSP